MASTNTRVEDNMKSTDDSLSMAPYNNFNSLTAEDSVEQIRRRKTDTPSCRADSVKQGWTSQQCYKFIDVVAVMAIIVVLWLILSLPTILYIRHTIITEVDGSHKATEDKAMNSSACPGVLYERHEAICQQHLQSYMTCLKGPGSTPRVYIPNPFQEHLLTAEDRLSMLSQYSPLIRQQCYLSLEPFVCLYLVHLCDDEINIGPSEEQCKSVSKLCDTELTTFRNLYPQIDEYFSKCASESPFDNKDCNVMNTPYTISTYNCSAGFYFTENGSCQPECNVWSPYPKGIVLTTDILNILAAIVCVLSGASVLVLSWIRHQKLCRHPSIFIIYQTVLAVVLSILVLVGVSARKRLFCRSRSLMESVRKPTAFCFITGIALYYIVMQLLLWWLWHTVAMFWGVMWPFHARKFNRSRNVRYLHFVFVVVSLILPVVPIVIVVFASSEQGGFTVTRAPPILCAGYDLHTNFWGFIFPLNLLLAIGVTLLVFILRIVIKNHYLSRTHKITVNLNWAVETKVLIVLCYYVILGAAVLSIFTFALFNINIKQLVAYFTCEARGKSASNTNFSECEKQLKAIQSTDNPIPISLAIVVLGFLPVVNLVYIVKCSDLKRKLKTYSQTRYIHYIEKEANESTASRYIPYNKHRDSTLQYDSVTLHDNTLHTEPLLTSQMNNDLRR